MKAWSLVKHTGSPLVKMINYHLGHKEEKKEKKIRKENVKYVDFTSTQKFFSDDTLIVLTLYYKIWLAFSTENKSSY